MENCNMENADLLTDLDSIAQGDIEGGDLFQGVRGFGFWCGAQVGEFTTWVANML